MAIMIFADKIYKTVNQDVIKDNNIDNIEYDINDNESNLSEFFSLNIVIPDKIISAEDFIENNANCENVEINPKGFDANGKTLLSSWVYFTYDFSYTEPLNGLSVVRKYDYNSAGNNELLNGGFQIFNPDNSGDYNFRIVNSKEEFDNLNSDVHGKTGLQYLGNNNFRLYNEILIYVQPETGYENYEYLLKNSTLVFYKYNLVQETRKLNNLTSNVFKFESNELINGKNTYNDNDYSFLIEQIKNEWQNGKETAEIKCSIGEYYDEEKNLVISTEKNDLPMLFSIGDEVIPYVAGSNNTQIPLSKNQDGTAKKFIVTKIRPNFDGACWQYLTLQEK